MDHCDIVDKGSFVNTFGQVFQWMVYNSTPNYDDMPGNPSELGERMPGFEVILTQMLYRPFSERHSRTRWVVYSTRRNDVLHHRGVENEGPGVSKAP